MNVIFSGFSSWCPAAIPSVLKTSTWPSSTDLCPHAYILFTERILCKKHDMRWVVYKSSPKESLERLGDPQTETTASNRLRVFRLLYPRCRKRGTQPHFFCSSFVSDIHSSSSRVVIEPCLPRVLVSRNHWHKAIELLVGSNSII